MPAKKATEKEETADKADAKVDAAQTVASVEVDREAGAVQVTATGSFDADALISLVKQLDRARLEIS